MIELTPNQRDILTHTDTRAAGGFYCGREPDVDRLCDLGLMEFAGRKSFVPDDYFRLTPKGRTLAKQLKG